MAEIPKLLNRELSWLEFNARVLEEARDPAVPLLERLKFLAICSSNLDEFFMVRVGGLRQLQEEGKVVRSPEGRTVAAQLTDLTQHTRQLVADQYACLQTQLLPALDAAGIQSVPVAQLTPKQQVQIERIFQRDLQPVLSPVAVEKSETFRWLPGLTLVLLVRLKPAADMPRKHRFALVRLPRSFNRFIALGDADGYRYITLEEIVIHYVGELFPGETIAECVLFRITRNADLAMREDKAGDLLVQMREVLDARKSGACVRLEIEARVSKISLTFLQNAFHISDEQVYLVPGPVDLSAYRVFFKLPGFDSLKDPPYPPQASPHVPPNAAMFDLIARKDILLFHPYESFDPVVRLLEQAADDPSVLAIKQILYRTNDKSRIIAALTRAAAKGKQVTVLVELKARFDEARNIEWAQTLERAGAEVIYGLKHLKVHAKVCIIVRREPAGIRRYVHFATGNYNEVTATQYSDIGLLTCHEDFAKLKPRPMASSRACSNSLRPRLAPANRVSRAALLPSATRWCTSKSLMPSTGRRKPVWKFTSTSAGSVVSAPVCPASVITSRSPVWWTGSSNTAASFIFITAGARACLSPVPTGCPATWIVGWSCSCRLKRKPARPA